MSDLEASPPPEHENPENPLEPAQEALQDDVLKEESEGVDRRDHSGLESALAEVHKAETLDLKVQTTVDLMEKALAQTGAPHFKTFWELRKLALDFFKENITPALRLQLWGRYTELTKEARRLKEILDEQTAFAVEQIEIAIKALEDEQASFAERLETATDVDFGVRSATLEARDDFYRSRQRELQLLNAEATRINALRKELIKTEMRVRQKNKFFQRLSAAGDRVFPRRKDLIKEVSESFITDVEAFVNNSFDNTDLVDSLFFLREEIKALQTVAKVLTLNTRSFTQTRTRLSESWEKVKILEKERKKERLKKKAQYRQQFDELAQKIDEVVKAFANDGLSTNDATKQLDEISSEMRSTELGRDEITDLRQKLNEAFNPIRDKLRQGEEDRKREEVEREQARKSRIESLRQRIEALLNSPLDSTVDAITTERNAILEEMSDKTITRIEKVELERLIKPVRDLLADRRALALLSLSADDQQTLSQLREFHKERLSLRQEIKAQLEHYRKTIGSSGLDFEQAMQYHEQQRLEKERLDKADSAIREIEQKIAELVAKIS